ncbi:hypothetical protein PENTCL1PPCAC_14697, partial [Pristionchus entomophagus]
VSSLYQPIIRAAQMTSPATKPTRPPFPLRTTFPSRIERAGYKLYNYLDNSLYPVRPLAFGAVTAAAVAVHCKYSDNGLLKMLPSIGDSTTAQVIRIGVVSLSTAYLPVFVIRFMLRHFIFKYKQWLFENPKKPSLKTKLWATVRYLLSLVPPRLKSCDSLLPRPSVPKLEDTVEKYLVSIQQLHSKEKLEEINRQAREFLADEGRKLQRLTVVYSLFVDNYVTGFWEKLAYLLLRKSVLINSSVALVDYFQRIQATQAARAARIAYIETQSQLAIDRQTFKPLGAGLICSSHLDKLYAITREPGEKIDRLRKFGISRHIAVICNGGIYKVFTVDENDRIMTVDELTDTFIELLARPDSKVKGAEGRVPALTTDNRTQWYHNRRRFFENIPKNAKALRDIESATIVITLDNADDWGFDPEKPEIVSNFMKAQLTGNGANRWADKSLNYAVCRNGSFGGTTEHSIADGCEFDAIQETFTLIENKILRYPPLAEQLAREAAFDPTETKVLRLAEKLEIEVNEEMAAEIDRCYSTHVAAMNNLHVASLIFRDWGKDRMKQCGCSPDAFVQMAIQLANYRDQGHFVPTYEAASARFYRNSRTETLRTVSDDSCKFVRAMETPEIARSERAELLRKACAAHATRNRESMVGRGVDRHLFVLYVMAQATRTRSPFLDHYVQQEWLLSTSHTPVVTNYAVKEEGEDEQFAWLGASFGPVAEAGYGICYRLVAGHSICMHITNNHSAGNTDSDRLRSHLVRALEEMSALFV